MFPRLRTEGTCPSRLKPGPLAETGFLNSLCSGVSSGFGLVSRKKMNRQVNFSAQDFCQVIPRELDREADEQCQLTLGNPFEDSGWAESI
jgi:hypothetical protein